MVSDRRVKRVEHVSQDQLLERIARRYEQLDQKLEELEAKLDEVDSRPNDEQTAPRKPR
jgi:BMFP domain-containing protein YqiC